MLKIATNLSGGGGVGGGVGGSGGGGRGQWNDGMANHLGNITL